MSEDFSVDEDPKCAECNLAIEEGSVVAFGNHIWHVECFRCAKCGVLVDHDSNLLLLSNGKPICENCSYNCRVCDRKIDDLAIMTGDDSYHSECFRCRLCQRKIEDLVFAKTAQGIYCIACHNGRMSKNRKTKSTASKPVATLSKDVKDKGLPSVPSSQQSIAASSSTNANTLETSLPPNTPAGHRQSLVTAPRSSVLPSPSRRPPAGPLPDPVQDQPISKKVTSPGFNDFDFDLNNRRRVSPTVAVPVVIDDLSSRKKETVSPSADDDRSLVASEGKVDNLVHTSDAADHRKSSVRERRRPTETELRLPKSHDELAKAVMREKAASETTIIPETMTSHQDVQSLARAESATLSLFPIKDNERLRSPLPQGLHAPPVSTTPLTSPGHDRQDTSSTSVTPLPPSTSHTKLQDNSAARGTGDGSTAKNAPAGGRLNTPPKASIPIPALPARSVDRPVSSRAAQKKQSNETIQPNSSSLTNTSDDDKSAVVQSLLAPPPFLPGSAGSPRATEEQKRSTVADPSKEAPVKPVVKLEPEAFAAEPTVTRLVPSTPSATSRRNFSGPVPAAKGSGRHSSSKSLESSPYYDTLLGSPVATFESDLSKAFNLSPRADDQPSLQSTTGASLDRSGTISRLASKVLKHRKSISASTLSPRPNSAGRKQSADVSADVVALSAEMTLKDARIAELEETLRQVKTSNTLDLQLESRKSLLASLESQIVETGAEHQSYLHHRHRASDTNVPLGEWKAYVVADLDSSLRKAKVDLTAEIEGLIRQRNDLQLENEGLVEQKASSIQEIAILEKRHSHLATMNQNMLKQIQDGMEANKGMRSPSLLRPDTANSRSSPGTSPRLPPSEAMAKTVLDQASEPDSTSAFSTTTSRERQPYEEDEISELAVTRISEDRAPDTVGPKKFNLVKKTKKAFRWGRTTSSTDVSLNSYSPAIPPPDRGMSTSRSSDKISNFKSANSGGMFKRTWQSQQSLSSHLDNRPTESPGGSTTMFGNDLSLQCEGEGRLVPLLVTSCINMIESRALEFEGLYRKSGGAGEMKNLIEVFENADVDGESVDMRTFDIPAITSVLKQYLRKLPTPLISFDAYEPFLGTSAIPDAAIRVRATKDVLRDLPQAHYQTLRALFKHLLTVSRHAEKNLMTTKNLAVVLGPSIIWDLVGDKEITDMFDKNSCVQFCIEHADSL